MITDEWTTARWRANISAAPLHRASGRNFIMKITSAAADDTLLLSRLRGGRKYFTHFFEMKANRQATNVADRR